jgi:hypothetical protein
VSHTVRRANALFPRDFVDDNALWLRTNIPLYFSDSFYRIGSPSGVIYSGSTTAFCRFFFPLAGVIYFGSMRRFCWVWFLIEWFLCLCFVVVMAVPTGALLEETGNSECKVTWQFAR